MLRKKIIKWLVRIGAGLAVVLVVAGAAVLSLARASVLPDTLNMSSDGMGMGGAMAGMTMPAPPAGGTPIAQLVAGPSDAPLRTFTLVAQPARITLAPGQTVDAWTFNGTVPGPELRVQQGDQVVVTLVNRLAGGVTIHWHGVTVPNAEDGVAGVTQDAVPPGASYTYRFIATDVGTYWYHSHQETSEALPRGLYGALIVTPRNPPLPYDRDYTVFLHEWPSAAACRQTCAETLGVNDRADRLLLAAHPGEHVRLRLVNGGSDPHLPVLVGAPFAVVALDGHDLHGPTPLSAVALPIGAAQRYDLSFVMPAQGAVALIDADDRAEPAGQHPTVLVRPPSARFTYPAQAARFDLSTYGTPAADPISLASHFAEQYSLALGNQLGFFNGEFTMQFTINGQTYPGIPTIGVKPGDLVKLHFAGGGSIPHAMHLHGHVFTVLARNGRPLAGSPVHLDTLAIDPGESYDVAFVADNPGLWMLHCHMVAHDAHGMDMMVAYPNIVTPYNISKASGNNPF